MSSYEVGKGKPPTGTRFPPKTSGNPRGRPPGRHRELPYEAVLGQTVTVRENGRERHIRADEAFLVQLARRGIAAGGAAARRAQEAIELAQERRPHQAPARRPITLQFVTPGRVDFAIRHLRMATLLDPVRPSARLRLEPWVVEAALARLGARRLTTAEQRVVFAATRIPSKVRWPEWWTVRTGDQAATG